MAEIVYAHIRVRVDTCACIMLPAFRVISSRSHLYLPFQFIGQSLLYKNSDNSIRAPFHFNAFIIMLFIEFYKILRLKIANYPVHFTPILSRSQSAVYTTTARGVAACLLRG